MASISVASLQALNSNGALKITNKALLMADATAALVTAPFDTSGALQAFPAGYVSGGIVTTDGFDIKRNMSVSTVQSDQLVQPDRADVDADAYTTQVKFQDTANKVVQAINYGLTLAQVSSMTPFFSATHNASGVQPQRRIVLIGEDTTRNVTVVKFFPNSTLNAAGDEVWQRKQEIQYDYTFGHYPDPALLDGDGNPTDLQAWIGGSGWAALVGEELPPAPWAATTAYSVGDLVTLSGDTLKCTTAGTSGSTAPTPPASVGGTVTDGTVVWTRTA